MALDQSLVGRTIGPTSPYGVSVEKIAEFTKAIGADPIDNNHTAPPTFPIVVAFPLMNALLADPAVGVELHQIVHGDQRFEQTRPIRAEDRLTATLTLDSLRTAAGMDMIGTCTEISTVDGEHVATARATLIHPHQEADA